MISCGPEFGNMIVGIDRADADDWSRRLCGRAERQVALEPPITLRERRRGCADREMGRMREGRTV